MNPITIAVKKLRSDDWAMNFPSLAAAVWTEGARTATCHMLFEHFKCRALAVGVTVPGTQFIFEGDGLTDLQHRES